MIDDIRSPLIRRPLIVLAWCTMTCLAVMCVIAASVAFFFFVGVLLVAQCTRDGIGEAWRGPSVDCDCVRCRDYCGCPSGIRCYSHCGKPE